MFDFAVAVVLMTIILLMIGLVGYRAVSGYHAAYYRAAVLFLIIGLNFNTTETVTGDVMSEFGVFMLFGGLFVSAVLVVVDAYTWYGKRLAKAGGLDKSKSIKDVVDSGLAE